MVTFFENQKQICEVYIKFFAVYEPRTTTRFLIVVSACGRSKQKGKEQNGRTVGGDGSEEHR